MWPDGQPPAAQTIEMMAKGKENSVWENITSSLNIFSLSAVVLKAFNITISFFLHLHFPCRCEA
ncbi:hypothetical protein D3C71_1725950 [compost metagenome]